MGAQPVSGFFTISFASLCVVVQAPISVTVRVETLRKKGKLNQNEQTCLVAVDRASNDVCEWELWKSILKAHNNKAR